MYASSETDSATACRVVGHWRFAAIRRRRRRRKVEAAGGGGPPSRGEPQNHYLCIIMYPTAAIVHAFYTLILFYRRVRDPRFVRRIHAAVRRATPTTPGASKRSDVLQGDKMAFRSPVSFGDRQRQGQHHRGQLKTLP